MKKSFIFVLIFLSILMINLVFAAPSCIPFKLCHQERSVPSSSYYNIYDTASFIPVSGTNCPTMTIRTRGGTTTRMGSAYLSTLGYIYSEPVGNSKPIRGCPPGPYSKNLYYDTCLGENCPEACPIIGYYINDSVSSSIAKDFEVCGNYLPNYWLSYVTSCNQVLGNGPFNKIGTIFDSNANCNTYLNAERSESICNDGLDNDYDGCIDLNDNNCGGYELNCQDSIDNDCDGLLDCNDPDCEYPNNPICPQKCTDSDGGLIYHQKGTTGKPGNTINDYCQNSTTLIEFTCATTFDGYEPNQYTCPYGCNLDYGKCNQAPQVLEGSSCETATTNTTCLAYGNNCTWTPPFDLNGGCCGYQEYWDDFEEECIGTTENLCTNIFINSDPSTYLNGLDFTNNRYCAKITNDLSYGFWYPVESY